MRALKTITSLAFILAYVSINAQKNSIYNFSLNTDYKQQDYAIVFPKINFSKKEYVFTAYNNNSNLYDTYFIEDNKYKLSSSSILHTPKSNIFTDIFIEKNTSTLQNNSLFFHNSGRLIKDSFNPYGTNDMKKAVLGGFLGLLFNN
jgi:hypothetical protein